MQLQLIQFSGITGKAFEQRLYDLGVPRLVIQVRDIEKAFEKVKDRGIIVDSMSGRPVYPEAPPNNTRAVTRSRWVRLRVRAVRDAAANRRAGDQHHHHRALITDG
jgi:hypothetical protein